VRLLLDTNRYVDFCRGDRQVLERVQEAERIYLPFVTWIAALALQHDLPLYARDHHFDHVPQLVRL